MLVSGGFRRSTRRLIGWCVAAAFCGSVPASAQDLQREILRLDGESRKAKVAVIALHEQALALIDGAGAAMTRALRSNSGASPRLHTADLTLIQDARLLLQSERLAAAERLHQETWVAFMQALKPEPRSLKELARRLGPFRAGLARYRPALQALSAEPLRTAAFARARNEIVRTFAEAHDAGTTLDAAVTAGDEASFVIVLRHLGRVAQFHQAVTERTGALIEAAEAALKGFSQRFGSEEAAKTFFAEVGRASAAAREFERLRAGLWSSLAGLDGAEHARPAADATGAGRAFAAPFADAARMLDATASAAIAAEAAVQVINGLPSVFTSDAERLNQLYHGVEGRFSAAAEAAAGAADRSLAAARKATALPAADRAAFAEAIERARAELPRTQKLVAELKAKAKLSKTAIARLVAAVEARRTALPALATEIRKGGPAQKAAPSDHAEVMRALTRRALAGDTTAQLYLGQMALIGVGGPPDAGEARSWFEKAAQAGDRRGQFALGLMLEEAGSGSEAPEWIQKAADQGLPAALTHVGLKLRRSDPASARRLLGLAAAQDFHPAMRALAEME